MEFGIPGKTGYQMVRRYQGCGIEGLRTGSSSLTTAEKRRPPCLPLLQRAKWAEIEVGLCSSLKEELGSGG
jgi:hypothetical protein